MVGQGFSRWAMLFGIAAVTAMAASLAPTSSAMAALGDSCITAGTLLPGTEDNGGLCQPTTPAPAAGFSCGDNLYFNGSQCVANNSSCTAGTDPGAYVNGICEPLPSAPVPVTPTAPAGFTLNPNAGEAPGGGQQPMCVNASPFIGGGVFVVSGTVLCYTGAGKNTAIYAYTDAGGSGGAWDPFNPASWDSLNLKDLFAQDDVTALGTLSVFGGAQIYSPDGKTGLQIDNSGVLIRSADDDGNVASLTVKPEDIVLAATDGAGSSSSLSVSGSEGIGLVGTVAEGGPGVTISGMIGSASDARMGVVITGSGQGATTAPASGPADWADVLLASKNFTLDNGLGSGIVVNDYGVSVRSASVGNSYNEFGSGAGNAAGSSLVNVIGDGGAGSVTNYIGRAGNTGTNVVNEIGTAGNGGASTNRIGNTNTGTSVGAQAGTTSMMLISGALDLVTGQGGSVLTNPTQLVSGGTATAMLGTDSRHAVVDRNGRVTVVNAPASEASSALYITNGRGTTNGVVATEHDTTISGGENNATSARFSDTGMHLSNSVTGDPVVVSGVADGVGPFDAANVRQLESGLASVAALTGLPGVQPGKKNSVGFAVGHHGSGVALALGGESLFGSAGTIKYGAALSHASGRLDTSASVGVGFSW
ncbi:YadA-like C-terminal region [Devosia enhydra]|uniref:YadA-like C-terminal region n=1 Tax=Devosia enhydra TaxID=665118 RepID=A0A1K2HY16_9HYPH|nr:YadA-like family protein [Devosia enhydra]SFZ83315.1 YadA-like C-terminal region [Devosia enhydra]